MVVGGIMFTSSLTCTSDTVRVRRKCDIHVLPAYTYIVREVQKEVVTIHANALHNRLRQREVKKSDCHRDQNGYHQFPQTALPCKTYRGARHRTYTLTDPL